MTFSVLAFVGQFVEGLLLARHPRESGLVDKVAYLIIATLAVALARAWALLQGKHVPDPKKETGHSAVA